MATSASFPTSRDPISSSSPIARAALMVAISMHRSGGMMVGSRCLTPCKNEQAFICSSMSTESSIGSGGTNAATPHGLTCRTVNETCSAVGNQTQVRRRTIDPVHQNPGGIEKPHLHEKLRIGLAGLAQDLQIAFVE